MIVRHWAGLGLGLGLGPGFGLGLGLGLGGFVVVDDRQALQA